MKRTYLTLIIMMLVIGFAAVSTNLVINGTINFGFNQNDFDSNVVFTYTNTMNGTATIQENGKAITFNTTKLENVNQKSVLDFDIANKSKQYDANVTIECGLEQDDRNYEEYLKIEQNLGDEAFYIYSGDTKSGRLTITLTKAYNESLVKDINMVCKIIATAGERNTEGTYTPVEHQYEEILLNGADPVLEATPVEGIVLTAETTDKKLIPVIIEDNGKVKRADTTKQWYDYENQWWANAVILNDGATEPDIDEEILEENIESYFVWIPKYRYKLFDMGDYSSIGSEFDQNKQNKSIEIKFGLEDTKDNQTECIAPNKSQQNGNCSVDKWMTHPAFTSFGDIKGFWVGKFETGYKNANDNTFTDENQVNTNKFDLTKIVIKHNQYSWSYIDVFNAFKNSYEYKRNLDSHMMKNTEWGAVVYLTHSIYGMCTNQNDSNNCIEVMTSNSSNHITGVSAKLAPDKAWPDYQGSKVTVPNQENDASYVYPNTKGASTTGNNTGIFDMNGGSWEYVAGVMTSLENIDGATLSDIAFGNSNMKSPDIVDKKYLDLYTSGTATQYNRRILGDATAEIGPFAQDSTKRNVSSMYNDWSDFIDQRQPWFRRSVNSYGGTKSGLFAFGPWDGGVIDCTFRIVLSPQ